MLTMVCFDSLFYKWCHACDAISVSVSHSFPQWLQHAFSDAGLSIGTKPGHKNPPFAGGVGDKLFVKFCIK